MARAKPKTEEDRLRAELARTKTQLRVMTEKWEGTREYADMVDDTNARFARRIRQLKRVLERNHIDIPQEIIEE